MEAENKKQLSYTLAQIKKSSDILIDVFDFSYDLFSDDQCKQAASAIGSLGEMVLAFEEQLKKAQSEPDELQSIAKGESDE